jgi:DNA ligase-1
MSITAPMLAATLKNWDKLDFKNNHYFATPKLDGIRALKIDGHLVSRTFKPIRNNYVRERLESILPDGADGEILVGTGTNFQETSSGVMSEDGKPNFIYHMFDLVNKNFLDEFYIFRTKNMTQWFASQSYKSNCRVPDFVKLVIPVEVKSLEELKAYEEKCLSEGYEGVILRTHDSPYKCGRATEKQQWLLKIKRFADDEAIVIGFGEKMHNDNAAETDALGHTKRSSAKDGLVSAGTLGYLSVKDLKTDIEFEIGSGFDEILRYKIWNNQSKYLGQIVKYKHFAITGVKDKPRFPTFLGFRDKDDM